MSTALADKLRLKEGFRAAVVAAPEGYLAALELPRGVELSTRLAGMYDFVQVFVRWRAEVERRAPEAVKALKDDGLLWFCYPKKSAKAETDLTRDSGWEPLRELRFVPVSLVAVDEVWSALRFRRLEKVKSR